MPDVHVTGTSRQQTFPVHVIGPPKQLEYVPSTHVCWPERQHSVPVHTIPLPKQELYVPATQVFPLVPPLLLLDPPELPPPELEPPELLPPELEPPELEPPELEDDSPQKNARLALPQAVPSLAHFPSTQAAARYESPLLQSQQVGLQSANVEHDEPLDFVPVSFSGFEGQPPFTCSA